ncbi:MAG TPA: trigger factor [Candidatus Paceibacterota bacterium]|jgi:FKBP-type peptidyl-prolyl cis-trans isomerase (trigger factor)|nr:trigger factor [Candidatus Paceibacterota bacterium]
MAKDYTVTVTPLPDQGAVEIKGEIPWDIFLAFEKKSFDRLAAHLELDGFRKGHVPEDIAKKHLGDELILSDMAELAIQELYPTILEDEKIDAIGRPFLSITKLARGNALGFSIKTDVLPAITLPDYRKIAVAVPNEPVKEVTEADVDKVIEDLRQLRAYGHVHGEHDEHQHTEPLPEVTDEFAQSFGEFKTVAELRAKVIENLSKENERSAKDKRRVAILEAIMEKTPITVPAIIIASEQDKIIAQVEADLARSGLSFDEYLTHAKKTREELRDETKPEAEKRAKTQLLINAIAKHAGIHATDQEVSVETETIMKSFPDADKARTEAYADMIITNEKVLSMLEK